MKGWRGDILGEDAASGWQLLLFVIGFILACVALRNLIQTGHIW